MLLADGGDHSYWHDRSDGAWGTSLVREALPEALARSKADRGGSRSAASRWAASARSTWRACSRAVSAPSARHSAALWFHGGDTPAGAFDDAADFDRHDVIRFAAARPALPARVWIDVGRDDPFFEADRTLAASSGPRDASPPVVHGGGHGGWAGRMARIPALLRGRLRVATR